jgi:hypothetical protein
MTESAPLQKGPPPILRINPSEIFFKREFYSSFLAFFILIMFLIMVLL